MSNLALVKPEVEVIEKNVTAAGRTIVAHILRMGETEGMTSVDLASLLGVETQNVYRIVQRRELTQCTLSTSDVRLLRDRQLLPSRGGKPLFLPKESIKAIIKVVNTPEAWAAYNQLWAAVENPVEAMKLHVDAAVGSPDYMLDILDKAEMSTKIAREALHKLKEAEAEKAKLQEQNAYLATKVGTLEKHREISETVVATTKRKMYAVLNSVNKTVADYLDDPITPSQLAELKEIVDAKVKERPKAMIPKARAYSWVWNEINKAGHTRTSKDIRQRHFETARDAAKRFKFDQV